MSDILPEGFTLDDTPDISSIPGVSTAPEGFVVDAIPEVVPPKGVYDFETRTVGVPLDPLNPTVSDRTLDEEAIIERSSVGEIMDAFGEGASYGWGDSDIGLSADSEKALVEFGVFPSDGVQMLDPLRAFNKAVTQTLASSLDTIMRTGNAAIFGTAGMVGELAVQTGIASDAEGRRLTRDVVGLMDAAGVVMGTSPTHMPIRGRKTTSKAKPQATIADETKKSQKSSAKADAANIEKPTQSFDQTETPAVDKAGNINLNRINAGDDVKHIIRRVADTNDDFMDQRRGVIPLEQTEELAEALGMTPTALAKRKVGAAFNAEEAVAARDLLIQSAETVRAKAMKAAGGADVDVLAFQEAMLRHQMIQEQVAGLTAEAGRALSSFRIMAGATKDAKAIGEFLEQAKGGRTGTLDIARRLNDMETPQQMSKFMMEARKATTGEMIVEAWINGLLSGPTTQVTNVLSNTLIALSAVPETAVAASIGKIRGAIRGKQSPDSVKFGEVPARLFGFIQGGRDGLIAGKKAFQTEMPTDGAAKLEQPRMKSIPSKTFSIPKKTFTVAGKEFSVGGGDLVVGGRQVRIPGRLLTAGDELFKAMGYRQELNAQAYRIAAGEGLSGGRMKARIAELIETPTTKMRDAARATAEYQTFTNRLGSIGQKLQAMSNAHPLMKIPLTFVRTPVNILKYAGERSILSIASKEVRETLKGKKGRAAQEQQMARIMTGSAISAYAWSLAEDGSITGGGPKDTAERALLYQTGWQPYSFLIGDSYYSYARMEPLGTLMGVTADMHEIGEGFEDQDLADTAALITMSVSKNLISKTWTKSVSDMVEAVNDSERYGERYISKLIGTIIPTVSAQVARNNDPYLREARTVIDGLKSRIPGMSADLKLRYDIWGQPIELEGALGPDLLSPIYVSKLKHDPVNQELLAIGVFPSKLKREIRGVELTDDQYEEYQIIAGRLTKTTLDGLVGQEGWTSMPKFSRQDIISKIISKTRNTARTTMIMRHPDILREAMAIRGDQMGVDLRNPNVEDESQ